MADLTYDYCVYGATEPAIFSAIAAKRQGLARVCLVIDAEKIDNFSTCGLGRADIGKSRCVGGLYKIFAKLTGNIYGWSLSYPFGANNIERLFWRWLGSWGVDVIRSEQVATVQMTGTTITQLTMESGLTIEAARYADGSLMGDVMQRVLPRVAIADNVDDGPGGWTVGTESAAAYGESIAGYKRFTFTTPAITRDEEDVLYNGVTPDLGLAVGAAFDGVMATGVRTMVTDDPSRIFPWTRITESMTNPYSREDVIFAASFVGRAGRFSPNPVEAGKYDLNSILILTDPASGRPLHWDYPTASYADRLVIRGKTLDHMRSRLYFTATDPAHSGAYQDSQNEFGTPRDEYYAGDRFTTRLPYFREGTRMIGEYVVAEQDLNVTDTGATRHHLKSDVICLATYSMDLKPTTFLTVAGNAGIVLKEGDSGGFGETPTRLIAEDGAQIPLRAILPKAAQCTNMMVIYCTSCTHVAWGSLRILTNAMIGEAAGVLAGLSIQSGHALHSYVTTNYTTLRDALLFFGVKLTPVPRTSDDDDEDGGGVPDGVPDGGEDDA